MSKIIALNHRTHYQYDRPIQLEPQLIRLRPAPHTQARIQSYSLNIQPKKHFINWQQDPFSNYQARIVIPEKCTEFLVDVDLVFEIKIFNPFDFFVEKKAEQFPFTYESELKQALFPYLEIKEKGKYLSDFIHAVDTASKSSIDFLVYINSLLNQNLGYNIRMDHGVQTCEETLQLKTGSCRDMAWLLCQILRYFGLATRFVSGYLVQLKADVKSLDGPSGTEKDFTDLHAWTEVYLPGAGWIGLDPTSGLFAGEGHIPLSCTPDPASAAPISGEIGACESKMHHDMSIVRIHEDRRVTKPYNQSEWAAIDALGKKVDASLEKQAVKLTMGGEPTFVSLDSPSDDAWNFTALSDEKYTLGQTLHQRLKQAFSKHGLTQIAQGKWYPGEPLPRWAMHGYWRKDGEPLWQADACLFHNKNLNNKYTLTDGRAFIDCLAETLGIPKDYVIPAYEDHEPVGFVLPLQYSATRERWISNRWPLKRKHLYLTAGDSPIGLRLPLKQFPVVEAASEELYSLRSSFDQKASLASYQTLKQDCQQRMVSDDAFINDPKGLIRNALSIEINQGDMHVFLPPLMRIEHFLELVTALEFVVRHLNQPMVLTGYPPPKDARLASFSVTPDPGVLEVNIQPASDWEELKHIITTVYEEARLSRLTTDKFLLDGRRVGTGGGNHIVMGSSTPENSPFLKRPDVLRSMVTFWQHHPALSYLFASMYIGPTSQAPRIDEARHDALYELELAFEKMSFQDDVPPWLVDRQLRNLLVDLSGNTHRAEFCIDKLYNPEGETGRLGLLEMRGFEMTPHPHMNLLQALLVRACIATFWKTPFHHKLIRWGTDLHDRFMLGYFIQEDLFDVLYYLRQQGYDFKPEWFQPFFDFRFPQYGTVQVGSINLSLSMALEPWPVMGEDLYQGSVSRAVDSSVERVQLKVTGAQLDRYRITCNGYVLPLKPTAEKGVSVAAVRFKAWAAYASLHPTLPVNSTLVFDVIDQSLERSLGGCTYHVSHPGGRNYEKVPINENEAEGRRLSRFQPAMGHSPGKHTAYAVKPNAEFPYTLDLRLYDN